MSRVGKNPITIPEKTDVSFDGHSVTVKGPLGVITRKVDSDVAVEVKEGKVHVSIKRAEALPLWGTWASHIKNMVAGVNTAYEKKLVIEGIGFKADLKGKELTLSVGFSHPVTIEVPDDIKLVVEKGAITISGINKEHVGQFAAYIRAVKKPEPYKGKGIRYSDEVIRRKQGKKAA